ncbi:MAG: hypothetical protein JXR84_28930, partial [Anaerolineae bacterium]|nr:hypothetical protein [Anaerolineae bacterium]
MKRFLMLVCSLIFSVLLFSLLFLSLQTKVEAAPTAPVAPSALFSDDFEDGNAGDWIEQAGTWEVFREYGIYRVVYTGTSPSSRRAYIDDTTVPGSSAWT